LQRVTNLSFDYVTNKLFQLSFSVKKKKEKRKRKRSAVPPCREGSTPTEGQGAEVGNKGRCPTLTTHLHLFNFLFFKKNKTFRHNCVCESVV